MADGLAVNKNEPDGFISLEKTGNYWKNIEKSNNHDECKGGSMRKREIGIWWGVKQSGGITFWCI